MLKKMVRIGGLEANGLKPELSMFTYILSNLIMEVPP